jgi:hypothetical protein
VTIVADGPPIRATLLEGNVWLRADDLVMWALAGRSDAGRELADKISQMIEKTRLYDGTTG